MVNTNKNGGAQQVTALECGGLFQVVATQGSWILNYEGTEFGPMPSGEAKEILNSGKLLGNVQLRRRGESRWISSSEFTKSEVKSPASDKRVNDRLRCLATVRFTSDENSSANLSQSALGIAVDISETGMKVLSQYPAGEVGTLMTIMVRPSQGSKSFEPFKATARVVRHLDSERGFAVAFISRSSL